MDVLVVTLRTKRWPHDGACHLFIEETDALEGLHAFARRIGLKPCWFQDTCGPMPHYDLTAGKRQAAIAAGAVEVNRYRTVQAIRSWREARDEKKETTSGQD